MTSCTAALLSGSRQTFKSKGKKRIEGKGNENLTHLDQVLQGLLWMEPEDRRYTISIGNLRWLGEG